MNQKMDDGIITNLQQRETDSQVSVTNIERKTQKILRINADDYSTKHLVIFWVLFVAIIIAVSLLTLALPPTLIGFSGRQSLARTHLNNCTNAIGFNADNLIYCNPVSKTNPVAGLLMRNLSPRNQFLFLYVDFTLQDISLPYIQFKSKILLEQFEVVQIKGPQGSDFAKASLIQSQQQQWEFSSSDSKRIYDSNGISLKGYRKFFGYQKYIEHSNSLVHFSLKNWPTPNVKEIYMDAVTVASQFTVFAIVIRYVFFAISLATSIGYYVRYRLIPQNLRTLEQKMILYLSIFTVLFNDPLYAATIMVPNGFTAFTSVAFIVNFITFLIGFWMVFLDRILYESGQKYQNVIDKKKIAYIVALYISLLVLQFQLALFRLQDAPIIPGYYNKKGSIVTFEVISFIIFALGLAYICIQFVRSAMNLFDKIWRNQMFLAFSFLYILVIIVMLVINGFSVYEYAGNRILILFTFMNMYTIYLQYMYSINTNQAQRLDKQKLFGHQDHRNEVQTIVSNFGNDQIMVDLDSEPQILGNNHLRGLNQFRHADNDNKTQHLKNDQNSQFQDHTINNLNQGQSPSHNQPKFDTFDIQD